MAADKEIKLDSNMLNSAKKKKKKKKKKNDLVSHGLGNIHI